MFIYEKNFPFILNQAARYYNAETGYYHKDTFLIALVFEWIRENNLTQAKKMIVERQSDIPQVCISCGADFAALYHGDKRGVIIYGNIQNAKNDITV